MIKSRYFQSLNVFFNPPKVWIISDSSDQLGKEEWFNPVLKIKEQPALSQPPDSTNRD